jgi:histidinol-phosphate aminotransferase
LVFDEKRSASKLAQELLERGMIVRDLKGYGLNAIRVTIGTPAQNDRFFELADSLL